MRGLWSSRTRVTLYFVDIHFNNVILPGVEAIGVDENDGAFENEEVVLGRNVLNMLFLLLEGPAQQTRVLERRPLRF